MANKERSTWEMVWCHRPVILNFGLLPGLISKQPHMLPMQRSIAYMTTLRELMQSGFLAQLRMDTPEPTLVVSGTFSSLAANSTLLWDTLVMTGQDCIAIYYPYQDLIAYDYGFLFGPEAATWGEFDKDRFVMPMEINNGQ
jgi:hypothetical protein